MTLIPTVAFSPSRSRSRTFFFSPSLSVPLSVCPSPFDTLSLMAHSGWFMAGTGRAAGRQCACRETRVGTRLQWFSLSLSLSLSRARAHTHTHTYTQTQRGGTGARAGCLRDACGMLMTVQAYMLGRKIELPYMLGLMCIHANFHRCVCRCACTHKSTDVRD
jgi:hypothetical protein